MMFVKKLIAIVLAGIFILGGTVYADDTNQEKQLTADQVKNKELIDKWLGDAVSVEDMIKYDFAVDDTIIGEVVEEKLEYEEAVKAVLALGIMSKQQDGLFHEEQTIAYNEFANLMLKLTVGKEETLSNLYNQYGDTHATTYSEAIRHIVAALGYDVRAQKYHDENAYITIAGQIGLLNGIKDMNTNALITRGALSQLIFNSLTIDLMEQKSYGGKTEYDVQKNKTILSERFQVFKVEGMITAVEGLNIYSSILPQKGEIYIDKIPYYVGDINTNGLIGYRVKGYAKTLDDEFYLIHLEVDAKDAMLQISIPDITQLTANKLTYTSGETGKLENVSLGSIEAVLYNGDMLDKSKLTSDLLKDSDGTILLSSEAREKNYSVLIINAYQNLVVDRVDLLEQRIILKEGFSLDGLNYIPLKETAKKKIIITKNNEALQMENIKPSNIISVIRNSSESYTYIIVSDKKASGTVDEIIKENDEMKTIFVDGEKYQVSANFRKVILNNSDYRNLILGTQGEFLLSFNGDIAGFRETTSIYKYGFMTKMNMSSGLNKTTGIRMFGEDGIWNNYNLAKKVTIDGDSNLETTSSSFDVSKVLTTDCFYKPVRYRLNSNDEIVFLDTIINNDGELSDDNRVQKAIEWNGELDWTIGYNLLPSTYSISEKTIIFVVPSDVEYEDDYKVISRKDFVAEQDVSLELYNADEFYVADLVVYGGNVQTTFTNRNTFCVDTVSKAIDPKGNEVVKVKGLKSVVVSPGVGNWVDMEAFFTVKMSEKYPDLGNGDLFMFTLSDTGAINNLSVIAKKCAIPEDHLTNPGLQEESASGIITKIDTERILLKVLITDPKDPTNADKFTYRTYMPRAILIYQKDTGRLNNVRITELNVGDRILFLGFVRHANAVVVR